ncbi:stAR-related lipid transfer protein 3-like isoform X1 [Asterias amurensis]|uniref:stAR-related lipid transfer protein 3-like isoform X1 n=2 Tax=Asterias amurensis TaxID=7602 RepID=UPI003AB707B3
MSLSVNNPDTQMADAVNGFQPSFRDEQAQRAAYTIYSQSLDANHENRLTNHSSPSVNGHNDPNPLRSQEMVRELRFSTVRRMFCLLIVFDFLLHSVLWFIYINLIDVSVRHSLTCQVTEYSIQSSLFDFVIAAAVRTFILLFAYALCRSKHWFAVAVTTSLSCIFLISKVFLYDFGYNKHDSDKCVPAYNKAHPVDFLIAIASFILPWAETWVFDYQVIPREKKLQEVVIDQQNQDAITERTPLLKNIDMPGNSDPVRFYSPQNSPPTSDTESGTSSLYGESLRSHASDFKSLPNSRRGSSVNLAASIQEQEYLQKAKESLRFLDKIIARTEGWHEELRRSESNAVINSSRFDGIKGKVYKLETELSVPPEQVVTILWDNIESSPSWNSSILESEVIQQIDDHTDVVYNVSTGGPGNIVAGRDFVSVRNYWQRGDGHVCSSIAVEHPSKPPFSKYVRGSNGPNGWVVERLHGDPFKSKFIWILNTDLNFKVWTPQAITDTALCHVLMDIGTNLQKHLQQRHQGAGDAQSDLVIEDRIDQLSVSSYEDIDDEKTGSLDSFGSA